MENNAALTSKGPDDHVLELIRKLRNDLIKDFLDERYLKEYFASKYALREVSKVKVEFIKKDLKELLAAPLDEFHYKPIIEEIRTSESASLAEGNEQLFYKEVEQVLRKYAYEDY